MNPPRYDTQCCPGYNDKVESGGNLGKLWVIVSIARFAYKECRYESARGWVTRTLFYIEFPVDMILPGYFCCAIYCKHGRGCCLWLCGYVRLLGIRLREN